MVLLLLMLLYSCKLGLNSLSSTSAYSQRELKDPTVQELARQAVCYLENAGWKDPNVPISSSHPYNIQDHDDLVQHFACIANMESRLGKENVNHEGSGASGMWQIEPMHLGKSITYHGKTYSCPNVSVSTLESKPEISAQCALYVYVNNIVGMGLSGLQPWEGKCSESSRQIFPRECNSCKRTKVFPSEGPNGESRFTLVVPNSCEATKAVVRLPLASDPFLPLVDVAKKTKDLKVLMSSASGYSEGYQKLVFDIDLNDAEKHIGSGQIQLRENDVVLFSSDIEIQMEESGETSP